MSDSFTFDSFASSTAYVNLFEKTTQEVPARQYEKIAIPGKNGAVLYDKGRFENVPIQYGFIITQNAVANVVKLRNELLSRSGYKRLSDTFDSGEFYEAFYNGRMKVEYSRGRDMAKGTLTFERKPQRFLTSGETAVTITAASSTLTNDTKFDANPLIRVVGNGSLTINGNVITVQNNGSNYIDIDSEKQDCYYGTNNRNADVSFSTGDFPVLIPGANTIALSGVTSIAITPRWWQI